MTIENKPDFVLEEHLVYLDDLREFGDTNMFGAAPYLSAEYPDLSKSESHEVLRYWMKTFGSKER